MKLNKLILLTPLVLSLAACNGNKDSYAGRYSFQLGSDNGTHAGIHLTLTDDLVPDMEIQAKKFSLEFDVAGNQGAGIFNSLGNLDDILKTLNEGGDVNLDDLEELYEDATASNDTSETSSASDEPMVFNGYYYTEPGDKNTKLYMGISLDEYGITIDDALVEKVMYAYIADDTVSVVIPVSVKDFLYQLYWYGYRVAGLDSLAEPRALPDENPAFKYNEPGTHPTKDDCEVIQKWQKLRQQNHQEGHEPNPAYEVGEFIYNDYHDYHTLTMGLAKDGKK